MNKSIKKKYSIKQISNIVTVLILICFLVFLIMIPHGIMGPILGKRVERPLYESSDYGVDAQPLFLNTEDGLSLAAWHTKSSDTKGTIIILSGIESPSVTAFFGYAKMFADNGWDSLLVEIRARNLSEGEEVGLGYTEWNDVIAGVNYIANDSKLSNLPIIAMGTSLGGSTSIIAAGEDSRIDGVISISGFSSWEDAFVDNMELMDIPSFFCALEKPFVKLYSGFHYGFNVTNVSPLKALKSFEDRPILLMHSREDSQVPYESFQRLKVGAEQNRIQYREFIRDGDEHFVCYEEYFNEPTQDTEFRDSILDFLKENF